MADPDKADQYDGSTPYYSYKYIRDCIARGQTLPIESYRIVAGKAFPNGRAQFTAEERRLLRQFVIRPGNKAAGNNIYKEFAEQASDDALHGPLQIMPTLTVEERNILNAPAAEQEHPDEQQAEQPSRISERESLHPAPTTTGSQQHDLHQNQHTEPQLQDNDDDYLPPEPTNPPSVERKRTLSRHLVTARPEVNKLFTINRDKFPLFEDEPTAQDLIEEEASIERSIDDFKDALESQKISTPRRRLSDQYVPRASSWGIDLLPSPIRRRSPKRARISDPFPSTNAQRLQRLRNLKARLDLEEDAISQLVEQEHEISRVFSPFLTDTLDAKHRVPLSPLFDRHVSFQEDSEDGEDGEGEAEEAEKENEGSERYQSLQSPGSPFRSPRSLLRGSPRRPLTSTAHSPMGGSKDPHREREKFVFRWRVQATAEELAVSEQEVVDAVRECGGDWKRARAMLAMS
ncbi:hypothetical protein BZG36_01480 [Bifiguratus adelaidae]|uniref:Uncharacterized protein n=1 Tax=Bifiguratus adelaidae TaxID=1938954 RepID=A0A261Y4R7_9FUNG|nr:hypothetical protein BZG36_01480 [Bifiguratus adelaidae]